MFSDGVSARAGSSATTKDAPPRPRSCGLFRRGISILSVASLFFIVGAGVMFFDVPPSSFLRRAFVGGAAWCEVGAKPPPLARRTGALSAGNIDKPEKTCDGFTLCMYGEDSRAVLVNMKGDVVQQWHVPFSKIWPAPPHLRGRIDDAVVYFNDGHIYPNGDLLAVVEGPATASNPSNGYGLVKLDRASHILWSYAEKCHHDLDVGEDGTIYVLANAMVERVPTGLEFIPTPCMIDFVDVLSPAGKRLKRINLLDALAGSAYTPLLAALEPPRWFNTGHAAGPMMSHFADDARRRDVLHTNAVKVLSQALAPKFPQFKAGQLLISPRSLDAIAVLDPATGKIVWASRGPWRAQHDPSFLDNGHLLLFDNLGSPGGSRVLEFDPATQAFSWYYPGGKDTPFLSKIRGMCQRLPNGNTLIVNSDGGEVFEVAPDREVVWSLSCGAVELNRARRYLPAQLPFLREAKRARP